jgi:hypothetical protein
MRSLSRQMLGGRSADPVTPRLAVSFARGQWGSWGYTTQRGAHTEAASSQSQNQSQSQTQNTEQATETQKHRAQGTGPARRRVRGAHSSRLCPCPSSPADWRSAGPYLCRGARGRRISSLYIKALKNVNFVGPAAASQRLSLRAAEGGINTGSQGLNTARTGHMAPAAPGVTWSSCELGCVGGGYPLNG